MGPAGADPAGTLDLDQIRNIVLNIGPIPGRNTGLASREEYVSNLATAIQNQMKDKAVLDNQATHDKFSTAFNTNATKVRESIQATVKQCEQFCKESANSMQDNRNNTNMMAEQVFTESIQAVTEMMDLITKHETTLKGLNTRLNKAYATLSGDEHSDPSATAIVSDDINRVTGMRKYALEQIKMLQQDIVNHYDSAFRQTKSKTNLIDLSIPKDIHTGKGQLLIDNMKAYLRGRAGDYYAIIPYLTRISDDFNTTEGTFWEPPTRRLGGYNRVNNTMRQAYADQSLALFYVIKDQLTTETYNRICSTFKYGIHEQKENRCDVGDGPLAYFALISLFKPIKAAHRDALTEEFNTAWTHFTKGDPKKKIKHLRPKLVEAIQLGLQINWSTTGKKIIQVLSRNDHVMAQEIKRFEKGPDKPEDSNVYLQDLFAAIEAEADKSTLTFQGEKKEWHASTAAVDRRICKYGSDCNDTMCTRSHPQGIKHSRSELDNHKGKGKGSKGYKGATGKGEKGKGSKGKGKKGGKGRPACEAQGCSQFTPHPSKCLCTTCFKKVIDTGSIIKKDGTVFEFKAKPTPDQSKDQAKPNYGFSAEQLEGLRVISQASSYRAEGLSSHNREEYEPPAPACIKRARVAERMGARADAAKVSQDERTSEFLAAINKP